MIQFLGAFTRCRSISVAWQSWIAVCVASIAVTWSAVACSGVERRSLTSGQLKDANVLLITVDTLRADRLGAYGGRSALTPTLDRLANNGIRYVHAHAHVPMTLPSHASILTGLTPPHTGVRNNTSFRLDARVPTLATFFKRAGYRTGAFVGAFVLDARFGLAHDFDVYDDRLLRRDTASFHFSERRAKEVFDTALTWIQGRTSNGNAEPANSTPNGNPAPTNSTPNPAPRPLNPARWFAWVHLFDPHAPYEAPAEFRAGRSDYDAEVAYTDAMLGAFLDRLRASGQLDHTLIVVTADHGESLGEHGETTHGLFAYESTLAVPLILNANGIAPSVVDGDVAHVDIVPTILDLAGMPRPSRLDGVSLLQPVPTDRALYFEALDAYLTRGWAPLRGLVQAGWKYIDLPDAELYDLRSDRGEMRNMMGQDARADVLQKRLTALEAEQVQTPVPAALDADAEARLRSLGYVGTRPPRAESSGGSRRADASSRANDPKHLVTLNEQFNSALTAFEEGRTGDALDGFRAVLRNRPDFLTARTSAATALIASNHASDAVRLLRDAPADQAAAPELLAKLGGALRSAGDFKAAAATLERARAGGDRSVDVLQDLAIVYAQLGRPDAAHKLFEELTTMNPTSATAWFNMGLFQLQNNQPAAAANALRQAVDRDPQYGDAWNALGAALAVSSPEAAIEAWRRAEPLLPRDYDLLFNLAMLTAQSDRPREAIPYLRRFLAEAPRDRYARDLPRVQDVLRHVEQPGRLFQR